MKAISIDWILGNHLVSGCARCGYSKNEVLKDVPVEFSTTNLILGCHLFKKNGMLKGWTDDSPMVLGGAWESVGGGG